MSGPRITVGFLFNINPYKGTPRSVDGVIAEDITVGRTITGAHPTKERIEVDKSKWIEMAARLLRGESARCLLMNGPSVLLRDDIAHAGPC